MTDTADDDEVGEFVTVEWDQDLEIEAEITEPQFPISIEPLDAIADLQNTASDLRKEETVSLNSDSLQALNLHSNGNNDLLHEDVNDFLNGGVINITPVSSQETDVNLFSDICEEHSYSFLSIGLSTNIQTHSNSHGNIRQETTDLKQCKLCFQQFPDQLALKQHELGHIPVAEHCADICNCCPQVSSYCVVTQEDNYSEKKNGSEARYECARCSAEFTDLQSIENHTNNHECGKELVNICYICKTDYVALYCLRRHMRESHLRKQPYVCHVCDKRFNNKGSYKRHMVIHKDERPHVCLVCGMTFKLEQTLKRHWMTHAGEKPFKCTVCNKRFRVADHLKKHLLIHTGEKPFKCETCGQAFRGKYNLQKHETIHTAGGTSVKCQECDATFKHKEYLAQHMKIHTCTEKSFKCKICDKLFTRKLLLDSHLKTHKMREVYKETGVKPFECMFCDASYFAKVSLERHVAEDHSKKKRSFKCDRCNASFASKRKLVIHAKCHEETSDSDSETCDEDLEHKLSLKVHDKPNVCEICGEKFRSLRTLQRHRQEHNGVQRYTCEMCDECFSDLRSLKEHKWFHSGIKKVKCSQCDETFKTKRDLNNHQNNEHSNSNVCKPCFVLLERL